MSDMKPKQIFVISIPGASMEEVVRFREVLMVAAEHAGIDPCCVFMEKKVKVVRFEKLRVARAPKPEEEERHFE